MIVDYVKLVAVTVPLDVLYVGIRPFVQDFFIDSGMGPKMSSLVSDFSCIPSYILLSIPLARVVGIFREKKSGIEKKVDGKI